MESSVLALFELLAADHVDAILLFARDGAGAWSLARANAAGTALHARFDGHVWAEACAAGSGAWTHAASRAAFSALGEAHLLARAPREAKPDEHFDLLFAQSFDPVFLMRLDEPFHWHAGADREALLDYAFEHLRVTAINDIACRQLTATREEMIGSAPCDRWRGGIAAWRAHMRKLFDTGHTRHHGVKAPRNDGAWVALEGEYRCTYDAAGRITGYWGIQRDISRHLADSAELARSRERVELAIVGAGLGVWDIELATGDVYFDPRWMERFGYRDPETWRQMSSWPSFVHPDDLPATRLAFRDHLAGKTPLFHAEYRVRTTKGTWASVLSTGKLAGEGRMVGVCIDITERNALNARVAASERLAALGTLAAGVGHEINNPLTFVRLSLELMTRELAGPPDADKLRELIESARYGAERVGTVVRDLEMLARPCEGSVTVVDPVAVARRCLQIADHQLRHRARVEHALAPTPGVRCSEDRLVQVLVNLLVNAAQAIPEGDADNQLVRVATSTAADGRALIEIADTGIGIAGEDLDRIFDPFYTTKRGEGTGLGLSICRNLLAGMGGEIAIESEPGRGSRFLVHLPAAIDPPAEPVANSSGRSARRVLVIDDEPRLGELLGELFDGVAFTTERTARGALDRLAAGEAYDRVLCDLMMPEMTGMEFYDHVSADLRPRIVFITGGAFTERARAFLRSVPNRHLRKPFDVAQLADALRE
ncbi:MAG: PAS domain-containing protein [Deltaproteobacteria bacterium]|nr:PAS domain-containing protein [Deltaproteobacteria bacterium]